jgi:hypothetical protein
LDYVITTQHTKNTRTSVVSHAPGTRETGPAVRKRGKRRQPSIPSEHVPEDFLPCRHRRRYKCVNKIHGPANESEHELFAANGTRIATYGTMLINLNLFLSLQMALYSSRRPIIGVDFLRHYGLLVDPRSKPLLDTTTQLSSMRYAATTDEVSIRTIIGKSVYLSTTTSTFGRISGFRTRENSTQCDTPHRNHTRPTHLQQTPPPHT